ncbi:CDP-glucose 4,6-dehydratase [Pseudacidobacterium ailaaui]|uniref:CDP-glucose 4,6-dehydratase n=1 Tax=Pseudacidobacterium ailaaui TaxID=1382359 RepID=UPI001EE1BFB6|nr:CDP-glucose 4,6-dehydratase [Pseudacidobacterium ailaaui]
MAKGQCTMENLEVSRLPAQDFWSSQRVFLTGHSGFKGAWLSLWLEKMGAEVYGLSLPPLSQPNLFELLSPFQKSASEFGDIRDRNVVRHAIKSFQPTIAIHMAAQPLVRRSYRDPLETFAVNVMGTANFLESLRGTPGLKAVLIITTDKVYRNTSTGKPFSENDPLGGHDPYSASKAAAELVTASWTHSYFTDLGVEVATARAGNVIGGGDWSEDRLIPDVWRAVMTGRPVELRYPNATRPWQHVLEPLAGYLVFLEALSSGNKDLPKALNFGPSAGDELTVSQVADIMARSLGASHGWVASKDPVFAEMPVLSLDASLATASLHWRPALTAHKALEWTAEWYRRVNAGENAREVSLEQIQRYIERA